MNLIVLEGRLTKDPELRTTNNGKSVADITLAVNKSFKNQEGEKTADFLNITLWNDKAINANKYLKKGDLISVVGKLENRNFELNGEKRYTLGITADQINYLDTRHKERSDKSYER